MAYSDTYFEDKVQQVKIKAAILDGLATIEGLTYENLLVVMAELTLRFAVEAKKPARKVAC